LPCKLAGAALCANELLKLGRLVKETEMMQLSLTDVMDRVGAAEASLNAKLSTRDAEAIAKSVADQRSSIDDMQAPPPIAAHRHLIRPFQPHRHRAPPNRVSFPLKLPTARGMGRPLHGFGVAAALHRTGA
jgi:hypothetical protein